MKYLSIDIETTGLDPETCETLEFAAVFDDLSCPRPIADLPRFQGYVVKHLYRGEPFALFQNAGILQKVTDFRAGKLPKHDSDNEFMERFFFESELFLLLPKWLQTTCGFDTNKRITVAGKNFASFDLLFLKRFADFGNPRFHHRVLDPGNYFVRHDDEYMPDLSECLRRAGFSDQVSHRALDDALDVVRLIRHHFSIKE